MPVFDHRSTPTPPPPRGPGDSGDWRDAVAEIRQAHRDMGERHGARIDDLERRFTTVRDAQIISVGLDGKNGKLSTVDKRMDGARQLLIALLCASIGAAGTAITGWFNMRDQVTRIDSRLETITPLAEAMIKACKETP